MDTLVTTPARKTAANGRPPVYNPDNEQSICDLTTKMLGEGKTKGEIAAKIGVGYSTFNRWRAAHPKFRKAIEAGDGLCDQLVVNALLNRAVGMTIKETKLAQEKGVFTDEREITKHIPPDVAAAKHWLKHRASTRKQWKDVQTIENSTKIDIAGAIAHAIHTTQIQESGEIIDVPAPDQERISAAPETIATNHQDPANSIESLPDNFNPFQPIAANSGQSSNPTGSAQNQQANDTGRSSQNGLNPDSLAIAGRTLDITKDNTKGKPTGSRSGGAR